MRTIIRFGATIAVAAVAIAVTVSAALAFDVTGTWEGTYKCKGIFDGLKDKYEDALVANLTQTGTAIGADITFDGDLFSYNGLAIANAAKPDKGDMTVVICGSDDDLSTGEFDELGRLSVTTKPLKGTGSIKGTSYYSTTGPVQVYTCKWKLKRTSTVDPLVAVSCP
jgi:hypothetical protein